MIRKIKRISAIIELVNWQWFHFMNLGYTPPEYWFHSFTTQQYKHYLKVKSYSEYAHSVYETLHTTQDLEATAPSVKEMITVGKKSLRVANALRKEAGDFPAHLRHLMKLDWEYCISSCMAIHEYIEGNSKSELQLIPLLRTIYHKNLSTLARMI